MSACVVTSIYRIPISQCTASHIHAEGHEIPSMGVAILFVAKYPIYLCLKRIIGHLLAKEQVSFAYAIQDNLCCCYVTEILIKQCLNFEQCLAVSLALNSP